MKLWLVQRLRRAKRPRPSPGTTGHTPAMGFSLASLEHRVRHRVRVFLRHTWLVTILGTLIIGGIIGWAIYATTAPAEMRIAAGPPGSIEARFVQILMQRIAADHDRIRLQLVSTAGPQDSEQTIARGGADLAILPGTIGDSARWPVVAILRQNVMALIVPTPPPPPPPPVTAKPQPAAPAEKEAAVPEPKEEATKPAKAGKAKKETKEAKEAKEAKPDKNGKSAKSGKTDSSSKTADKTGKAARNDKVAAGDKSAKTAKSDDDDSDDGSGTDSGKKPDEAAGKLDKIGLLANHRVGIVAGTKAGRELLDVVLNHYGVAPGAVQVSQIDPNNLAAAVKAGQIDAIFVVGPATGKTITEAVAAATQDGRTPAYIPVDQADGIAKRKPAFGAVDIDPGTFGGNPPGPDDSLKTLSFPDYLVARSSFNHDSVAALARLIYTSRLTLAASLPGEIKIEAPSTNKDAGVAVHPGALAYLGDDQKSFFDKYGDDIFYGLLIFPIFGSTIAGLAGYLRSNGRTRRLRLIQKLLDMVRRAHAATTIGTLDQLQSEVDATVVAILHHSEQEGSDQTAQTSFLLALDHVRFAIAMRRNALLEQIRATGEAGAGAKSAAA